MICVQDSPAAAVSTPPRRPAFTAGPAFAYESAVSFRAELAAVRQLQGMLAALVSARATSVEEDVAILADLQQPHPLPQPPLAPAVDLMSGGGLVSDPEAATAPLAEDCRQEGKQLVEAGGREEEVDEEGAGGPQSHWRLTCAVTYRLTRKRIVDVVLRKLSVLELHLESLMDPATRQVCAYACSSLSIHHLQSVCEAGEPSRMP